MELKHVLSQDKEKSTATMLLYGAIGSDLNGHYFAQEINYLSENYQQIIIKINSDGGNVIQGLSIFNAMLTSPANIIAHIEGVAASMAGVIPMAADKIKMNDFARIMVHNPFIQDKTSLTPKEQTAISNLSQVLTTILSRRGIEETQMAEFLENETWFNPKEALKLGIIDEIVNTGKAAEVENVLTGIAAFNKNTFENFIIPKNEKMKILATLIGLDAQAEEAEIVGAVKTLQAENKNLKAEAVTLKAEVDTLKAEKAAQVKTAVESLTDGAIASGHFAKDQRDSLIEMGTKSFDTFKAMIEGLQPVKESLSAALASGGDPKNEEKHDFEWYRRNDPHALAEMKVEDKAKFDKLLAAWEKENN